MKDRSLTQAPTGRKHETKQKPTCKMCGRAVFELRSPAFSRTEEPGTMKLGS